MKSYLEDIKSIYQSSWYFFLACPLLFMVPAAVEFAQHVVEVQLGMYVSLDAFKSAQGSDERQIMGLLKVIATVLPGYWYVRYLGFGRSARAARTIEMPAIGLWLVIFAFSVPAALLGIYPEESAALFGVSAESFKQVMSIGLPVFSLLGIYLVGWSVAWSLGNAAIGWIRSAKLMHGHFIRTLIYYIAGVAIYVVIHQVLSFSIFGYPDWVVWLALTFDSFLVGFIALNSLGAGFFAANRAAKEKGVSLTGQAQLYADAQAPELMRS